MDANSIHRYSLPALGGGEVHFSDFAGKRILVVNVASECGYTPQYTQLQELHAHFGDRVAVVGCPCNDFGGQEPGSAEQIRSFCQTRYGVDFVLTGKIGIKNDMHPLYKFLTKKVLNGVMDSEVRWNFHKYVLDERGLLLAAFGSGVSPLDESVLNALGIALPG